MKATFLLLVSSVFLVFNLFSQEGIKTGMSTNSPTGENKIGGHFGLVQYFYKSSSGKNEVIGKDFYEVGFPAGITIKREDLCFDIEMVPFIDKKSNVSFLFHPGVLFPLGNEFNFGTRAAFDIGKNQYGFTPLLSKFFKCKNGQTTFLEFDFPVRFSANGPMTNVVGLHLGVQF